MKFSIITASNSHDSKRLIELESNLEAQSNHNFDWIIACNQPNLDLHPADFKIKRVSFSPNTLGSALNQAIKVADGQELIFVDADDYLTLDTINDNHTVIDLNDYYTYEPKNIFINSIRKNNSSEDALPETPYKINNFHPVYREFNYSNVSLDHLNDDPKYQAWLFDKYWILAGINLYKRIKKFNNGWKSYSCITS
ncbi:MAG: Hypothetical protein AJITA_00391 [Acetilactobacillus jinshanensis]